MAIFPKPEQGQPSHRLFRGFNDVHFLTACQFARRPHVATCLPGSGSFIASTAAGIASRSERPLPGQDLSRYIGTGTLRICAASLGRYNPTISRPLYLFIDAHYFVVFIRFTCNQRRNTPTTKGIKIGAPTRAAHSMSFPARPGICRINTTHHPMDISPMEYNQDPKLR